MLCQIKFNFKTTTTFKELFWHFSADKRNCLESCNLAVKDNCFQHKRKRKLKCRAKIIMSLFFESIRYVVGESKSLKQFKNEKHFSFS